MRTYPGNILLGIAAAAALAISATASADMGRTVGTPGVSPSGAATYSIPIALQPGPNGVQPSLAFVYNNQGGNGTMGVGWGLSGFRSIERCPWSIAEDGADRAVRVDVQDRFCLDGNKLRITSSSVGNYGAAGAVYETQLSTVARVTSVGTAGTGPQSFVVQGKDGMTYEFGNTADSRVIITGTTVYRWLLNKASDRDGNSYVVTYTTDNSVGRVPLSVQWAPTAAGASTYQYKAQFNYVTKTNDRDFVTVLQQGFNVPTKQRLSSVEIGYSASGSSHATKRQYVLTYEASPTTQQSRLTEIKECGATTSNCLLPTAITYQNGNAGVVPASVTGLASAAATAGSGKVDFNGDGRSDIVYSDGSVLRVAMSTGSGFAAGISTGIASGAQAALGRFVSPSQDGYIVNVGGTVQFVGFNGTSFTTTSTGTPWMANMVVTDYNGDGLHDFMWYTVVPVAGNTVTATLFLRPNTTSGAATVPSFAASATTSMVFSGLSSGGGLAIVSTSTCPYERKCDINGDGRADLQLVVANPQGCGPSGCSSTHTGYDLLGGTVLANGTPQQVPVYYGLRFNDDPCTDTIRNGTLTLRVSSCGDGAVTNVTVPAAPLTVMDWDGDARTDLIVNAGGFIGVYRSRGSTTTPFDSLFTTAIPYLSTCNYFAADFDGDGLDDLACARTTSPFPVTYYTHNGLGSAGSAGGPLVFATQVPNMVASITDGYGNSMTPSYVSTGQGGRYTRGTGTTLPLVDATAPMFVVGRLTLSDGLGSTYNQDYTYKGARRHATLGIPNIPWYPSIAPLAYKPESDGQWAGFEQVTVVDSRSGRVTRTTYEQLFPLAGMVKKIESFQSDGTTPILVTNNANLVTTLDSATNNQRYFTYLSTATTDQYEVGGPQNGQLVTTSSKTFVYGDPAYGNLTSSTTTVTDKDATSTPSLNNSYWTSTETITYAPADVTNWCVGLVTQAQVAQSSIVPGTAAVTRTTGFTKDSASPAKCRVSAKTVEPSSDKYRVTTTFGYDAFGNVASTSVVGRTPTGPGTYADMTARVTAVDWGTTGQFPTVITDAAGTVTRFTYNNDLGTLQKGADPSSTGGNPIEMSFLYDDFQRRTRATNPDGTYTTWDYVDCTSTGCMSALHKYSVVEKLFGNDGALINDRATYFDAMERPLVDRTRLVSGATWDGSYQWSEKQFDALGRVSKQYMPCTTASATTTCRSNATTFTYDALDRVTQESRPRSALDSTAQTRGTIYSGRTQTKTDALGKITRIVMDANGSLRQTQDANGFGVAFTYDAAGTITGTTDSTGATRLSGVVNEYGLSAFQVASTDSALGATTRTYNSLGELIRWTDGKGQVFSATYDALSRMLTRDEPDASTRTTWTYGNSVAAFNVGKPATASQTEGGETYTESYAYDSRGRLSTKTFAIPGAGNGSYAYDYAYHSTTGMLDTLTYPALGFGSRLAVKLEYQNGSVRRVSDATSGGEIWSTSGSNAWGQTTQETFGGTITSNRVFDAVTALVASIQSGTASNATSLQNQSYAYDAIGNVTQRQNNRLSLTENFYYAGATDNLHRLEHSDLTSGGSPATNLAMSYDPSGNILSKAEPGLPDQLLGQAVTWTSYNYPASITSNGESAVFAYGPDRQRWRMAFTSGGVTETTYYIGDLLEKVVTPSQTKYRLTVYAGNTAAAIVTRISGSADTVYYVLPDHQGSVETVATVSGSTATSVATESFTAYGERRDSGDWSGAPANRATLDGITRQGYTYQTALGSMGLNHMNGRVQDAVTGRFLSADPFLSDPQYTQNYNRYSYVYNNPATFTDPSGFDCFVIQLPPIPYHPSTSATAPGGIDLPEIVVTGYRDNPTYTYCPPSPPIGPPTLPPINPPTQPPKDPPKDPPKEDEYEPEVFVAEDCGNEGGFLNWFKNAGRFASENSAANPLDPGSMSSAALLNAADQGSKAIGAARGVSWRLGFVNGATRFYTARMLMTAWYAGSRIGSGIVGAVKASTCKKKK